MAVAPNMKRTTTTVPKEHIAIYEGEVNRLRTLGERTSVADQIRKAIARDVKRIQRSKR